MLFHPVWVWSCVSMLQLHDAGMGMHSTPSMRWASQSYELVPQPMGSIPAAVHSLMYFVAPLASYVKPLTAGSLNKMNGRPLFFPPPPAAEL